MSRRGKKEKNEEERKISQKKIHDEEKNSYERNAREEQKKKEEEKTEERESTVDGRVKCNQRFSCFPVLFYLINIAFHHFISAKTAKLRSLDTG